jgi:hypothetical protein
LGGELERRELIWSLDITWLLRFIKASSLQSILNPTWTAIRSYLTSKLQKLPARGELEKYSIRSCWNLNKINLINKFVISDRQSKVERRPLSLNLTAAGMHPIT